MDKINESISHDHDFNSESENCSNITISEKTVPS